MFDCAGIATGVLFCSWVWEDFEFGPQHEERMVRGMTMDGQNQNHTSGADAMKDFSTFLANRVLDNQIFS